MEVQCYQVPELKFVKVNLDCCMMIHASSTPERGMGNPFDGEEG